MILFCFIFYYFLWWESDVCTHSIDDDALLCWYMVKIRVFFLSWSLALFDLVSLRYVGCSLSWLDAIRYSGCALLASILAQAKHTNIVNHCFINFILRRVHTCRCGSELTSIDLCQCMRTLIFTPNFMMNTSIYYTIHVVSYIYAYVCLQSVSVAIVKYSGAFRHPLWTMSVNSNKKTLDLEIELWIEKWNSVANLRLRCLYGCCGCAILLEMLCQKIEYLSNTNETASEKQSCRTTNRYYWF